MTKDWTKGRVRLELEKIGIEELAVLDRRNNLRRGCASDALVRPTTRGERAISEALGISPAVIWPSRYDENGVRLKPQPSMNYIERTLQRHGQKGRAA